jgi:hypothetical protein
MHTVTAKVTLCAYHTGVRRNGGIAAPFLNLGTPLKTVIKFILPGREHLYSVNRDQVGPRALPWPTGDEKRLLYAMKRTKVPQSFNRNIYLFFCIKTCTNTHTQNFYCEKPRESDELKDQGVDKKNRVRILRNSNGRT